MTIKVRQLFSQIRDLAAFALMVGACIPCTMARETDVVPLIQGLQNPDVEQRIKAIQNLSLSIQFVKPALMGTLSDPNHRVRSAGMTALVQICDRHRAIVSEIIDMLDDPIVSVRCDAVRCLGTIGPDAKVAVPELIALLSHEETEIRSCAASALGEIGPDAKAAVPRLITVMTDPNQTIRETAIKALGKIDFITTEAEQELVEGLTKATRDPQQGVRLEAAYGLARSGIRADLAIPIILEAATDGSQSVGKRSATAIRYYGPTAVSLLAKTLKEGNQRTRHEAAKSMALLGEDAAAALPALINALDDSHASNRSAVAQAIAAIGPEAETAVPKIIEMLADTDPWVRQSAAEALGSVGLTSEASVSRLIALLDDPEPQVRDSAAKALGGIGVRAKAAVPRLIEVLSEKNIHTSTIDAAIIALGGIGYEARKAVPTLVQVLLFNQESYSVYQRTTAETLAKIGPQSEGVLPALLAALAHANSYVQGSAAHALADLGPSATVAIPALVKIRDESSENLQLQAAYALGRIDPNDREAVPRLLEAMNGKYNHEAIKLLGWLGIKAEPAVSALVNTLGDSNEYKHHLAAGSLIEIGKESQDTVDALVVALTSEQRSVRYWSATILGDIGPKSLSVVSTLKAVMEGDDYLSVRMASRQAIAKILRVNDQIQRKQDNQTVEQVAKQAPIRNVRSNELPVQHANDEVISRRTNEEITAAAEKLIEKITFAADAKEKKWRDFTGEKDSYIQVEVREVYDDMEIVHHVYAGYLAIAWNRPAPGEVERFAILNQAFHPHEVREMFDQDLSFSNVRVVDERLTPNELGQATVDALPSLRKLDAIEYAVPTMVVTIP